MTAALDLYAGLDGKAQDVVDLDEYSRTTRTCHKKLQEIWNDLELSDIAQEQQLKEITDRALGVWNSAVEHADQHRLLIRKHIDDAKAEIKSIAEQLGEHSALEESRSSTGSLAGTSGTLKRWYDEVVGELDEWKRKRQARVAEHDAIQQQICAIRSALGMAPGAVKKAKHSITRANMDFLKLELERMRGEKVRRERKMEATLAKLRKLCIELGADDAEVAASVHPTLRTYHQTMRGHYFSAYPGKVPAPPASESGSPGEQVVLSDEVFNGLNGRVTELQNVKEERESRLGEMQEVLNNMWNLLEVAPSDENRAFFEKMLQAPARLHAHSLDKCSEEISRLEAEQAKSMRGMIHAKAAEVARLCRVTCLPVPNLSMLIDDSDSPGQVADALSKIVRMLAEVNAIVEQRDPVIKLIAEVEAAYKEVHWHYQHQQENLFNNRGRDANRLLQRAIKAEEKKKKLPKLIARLQSSLKEWAVNTSQPFVYGRTDYLKDVLAIIEEDFEDISQVKPKKVANPSKPQRPGTAGGKPPKGPNAPSGKVPMAAVHAIARMHEEPAPEPALRARAGSGALSAAGAATPSGTAASTAPSVTHADSVSIGVSDGAGCIPVTPIQGTVFTSLNPLQDLVNNLANASTLSRNTSRRGSERYGVPPTLSSLQIDDHVNFGSAAPSPAPQAVLAPALVAADGVLAPLEGAAQVSEQQRSLHLSGAGNLASPAESVQSHRSVRSEALSHLSMNVANVTVRKGRRKENNPKVTPVKSPGVKKSPVPEHSVMHVGMMQ